MKDGYSAIVPKMLFKMHRVELARLTHSLVLIPRPRPHPAIHMQHSRLQLEWSDGMAVKSARAMYSWGMADGCILVGGRP